MVEVLVDEDDDEKEEEVEDEDEDEKGNDGVWNKDGSENGESLELDDFVDDDARDTFAVAENDRADTDVPARGVPTSEAAAVAMGAAVAAAMIVERTKAWAGTFSRAALPAGASCVE